MGDFNPSTWDAAYECALEDVNAVPLSAPDLHPTYRNGEDESAPDRCFYVPPADDASGVNWLAPPDTHDDALCVPVGPPLERHRALLLKLPLGPGDALAGAPARQPKLRLPRSAAHWRDLDDSLDKHFLLRTRRIRTRGSIGHANNLRLLDSVCGWLR